MSIGGGSTSTNEFKPPGYTQQPWKDYLASAQQLGSTPLAQYQGQVVAPLTGMTAGGLQQLSDFAQSGSPERSAGGAALLRGAAGPNANPYATAGNPYLMQMIDASNAKIADRYKSGTAAQNDAMHARSGTFGGSAWQDQVSRNEQDLAGALGANTNTLLGNQYNQAAQLQEAGLNRGINAAQVGIGQQGADLQSILAAVQGGQIPQQNYQQLLDAGQKYFQQGQQNPFTLSDFLGSALSRASGTGGQQTYTSPGQSPITAGLGGLGIGYGLFG